MRLGAGSTIVVVEGAAGAGDIHWVMLESPKAPVTCQKRVHGALRIEYEAQLALSKHGAVAESIPKLVETGATSVSGDSM